MAEVDFFITMNFQTVVRGAQDHLSCNIISHSVPWPMIYSFLVLKQGMNSSWAQEQNVIACYQLNDLGLPWQQFESSWWWKSPLRPSRNFWKVARMEYIIILSGHNEFQEIRPENMALKLFWSCRHDKCLSEFDAVPCRHQSVWRQDGDRHTGDTKSLDVCRL